MQQGQVERVAELMERMATGDTSAAFTLYEEFGPVIRRVVRGHLADMGVKQIDDAELDALTLDAVIALLDSAASWRPDGGAMPWTWADRRLRSLASGFVGQWTDEFGDEHDGVAPRVTHGVDRDEFESLKRVARRNPTVQLLVDALRLCCTQRDSEVLLSVKAQAAAGDPSPSNTVAAQRGMTPVAVRKVVSRARTSLRTLAERDEQFAELRELPLLLS